MTVVRAAVSLTLAVVLLGATPGEPQPPGKVYRVGYITVPSRESAQDVAHTFALALRDLGWVEGQNLALDFRYADSNLARVPELAAELVRLKPDVIVAGANVVVAAVKNATPSIPIVMLLAIDPVGSGLVTSLARPGGNVTGLTSTAGPEMFGKQLQLLKSAFPRVSRVAILVQHGAPTYERTVRAVDTAAGALGLQRQIIEIRDPGEFDAVFAGLTAARYDAIFAPVDSMFYQHRVRLARLALKTRLPAMWGLRDHVDAGGLMAYSTDLHDLARRAAVFVDKILKGAKPADLPVEQPTKFEFVINLKTAKALGVTIPPSVLVRADHVIAP